MSGLADLKAKLEKQESEEASSEQDKDAE